MSILIRGMEMPERCGQCFLRVGNCKQRMYMEHRPKGCPLVEVKEPHGRLIDATFEENHYASMLLDPTPDVTEQNKHKARIIIEALRMAKTAIEAEGSET